MTCGVLSTSDIMRRTGSKGAMDRMMSTGSCMRLCGRTGHRQLGKVGARQPRFVRIVDDDRSIAKEGRVVGRKRGVEVKILGHEWIRGDLAVLATQITDLTTLGLGSIASRRLATMIRVQMSQGARTVAIGSRLFVDVVHKGAAAFGEVFELDSEPDALAARSSHGGNRALDVARQISAGEEGLFG